MPEPLISEITARRHKDGSVTWVWENPNAHVAQISREAFTELARLAGWEERTMTDE